jgi:hypothetical protein
LKNYQTNLSGRKLWQTHSDNINQLTHTEASFGKTVIERPLKSNPFYLKSSYGPKRNVFKGG